MQRVLRLYVRSGSLLEVKRERESPSILYGGRGALEKLLWSILEGRKHQPKPLRERSVSQPSCCHGYCTGRLGIIWLLFSLCVCCTPRCLNTRNHCMCETHTEPVLKGKTRAVILKQVQRNAILIEYQLYASFTHGFMT